MTKNYKFLLFGLIFVITFVFGGVGFAFTSVVRAEEDAILIKYYNSTTGNPQIIIDNPSSITQSQNLVTLTETPTPATGYKFDYWGFLKNQRLNQDLDAGKYYITYAEAQTYKNSSNVVSIYAFWTPIDYNLTFSYNQTNVSAPKNFEESATFNIESVIDLTLADNKPRKNGYVFEGWFLDDLYSVGITEIKNQTGDLHLYGKFTKENLVITFAETEFEQISFEFGQKAYGEGGLLENKNPTKEGYTFEGWYTTSDCKEGTRVSKNYIFQTSVTLYAKWVKNPSPVWWIVFGVLGGAVLVIFACWYFFKRPIVLDY